MICTWSADDLWTVTITQIVMVFDQAFLLPLPAAPGQAFGVPAREIGNQLTFGFWWQVKAR